MRSVIMSPPPLGLVVEAGPAPILQWIKIADLVIDDSYQRDLRRENWTAIRRIAANFKWSRFSPVFVSPVEGGHFAMIDGQHRTHAAAMCGFDQVPCQIVQMSQEEQAASFAAVNGMVTKVTSLQLFKARLSQGEEKARIAASVAEKAGCVLKVSNASANWKKPGEIYGPKSFLNVIEERGPEPVTAALIVLLKAEGYCDAKEVWDMSILEPLLLAITAKPDFIVSPALVGTLEEMPIWDMVEAITTEIKRCVRLALPYKSKKAGLAERIERYLASRLLTPKAGGPA